MAAHFEAEAMSQNPKQTENNLETQPNGGSFGQTATSRVHTSCPLLTGSTVCCPPQRLHRGRQLEQQPHHGDQAGLADGPAARPPRATAAGAGSAVASRRLASLRAAPREDSGGQTEGWDKRRVARAPPQFPAGAASLARQSSSPSVAFGTCAAHARACSQRLDRNLFVQADLGSLIGVRLWTPYLLQFVVE